MDDGLPLHVKRWIVVAAHVFCVAACLAWLTINAMEGQWLTAASWIAVLLFVLMSFALVLHELANQEQSG